MTLSSLLAVEVLRVVTFEVPMDIEQKLEELEKRRRQGMRLLSAGVWPAEVARRVGVSRQSVLRWTKLHERGGMAALKRPQRFGRPPKLSDAQRAELIEALKRGALAAGFTSELWTLPRIGMLIKERFGVQFSQSSVWRLLQQLGWSVQRPTGRARQRDEVAIRTWKEKRWPAIKKSPRGRAE
jgi:transposase